MSSPSRRKLLGAGGLLIALGFAVGIVFTSQFDMEFHWKGAPSAPSAQLSGSKEEINSEIQKASNTFVEVAKRVSPSVVTVASTKVFRLSDQRSPRQPNRQQFPDGQGDPFDFFHRFFPPEGPGGPGGDDEQRMQGLGSGVIITEDGYILTNNHVIAGADEIEVAMGDGHRLSARLIGTDPKSDVAVIKVEAQGLSAVEIGDSDHLQVGEWVLAIGNPFSENLSHTVTAGIVSAVGRSYVGLTDYEDYIQTDAAINPGNSGGALVDVEGKLVGLNTAIATRSGGSQGVGFAIPINLVSQVKDALIRDGRVTRGWLGVQIQNLTDDLAEAKGVKVSEGVLVGDVLKDGPAAKSELQRGDVITALDGRPTKNTAQLRNMVAGTRPGTKVDLTVIRSGKERNVSIKLGELPDDDAEEEDEDAPAPKVAGEKSVEKLGIEVSAIDEELQDSYELERDAGVVVTGVKGGSMAARQGIREGDVILEVNNKPVKSLRDYRKAMGGIDESDTVLFLVERDGTTHFVAIKTPPKSED